MAAIRLAISQFRPAKGDYAGNVARIGGVIAQAAQLEPKPDLIVFPETATSGYFVEGGVKEVQLFVCQNQIIHGISNELR